MINQILAQAIEPRELPDLRQWAEANIKFNVGMDAVPSYVFDRTPWHGAIFDWFTDRETEEIFIISSAQSGKSTALIVCILFILANDPSPLQVTFPDESLTKAFTFDRLFPILKKSLSNSNLDEFKKKLGGTINGSHLHLAWASSEQRCRSWARRILINDETSLYKLPLNFIFERTKAFRNRKIISCTTPTNPDESSWRLATEEYALHRWHVQCPHCQVWQPLEFENLHFAHCRNEDGSWNEERIEQETYYQCSACQEPIGQEHRLSLLARGRAVCETPDRNQTRKSLRITCLDSPTIPWHASILKFLKCKNNAEDLAVWNTQWLAKPHAEYIEGLREARLKGKECNMPFGLCPADTEYLIAGIDCQKHSIYLVVRAFLKNGNSQLVYCENIEGSLDKTLDQAWERVINREWSIDGSQDKTRITACAIDSGYMPDIVYDFCRKHRNICYPVKGAAGRYTKEFTHSVIDRTPDGRAIPGALILYVISSDIFGRQILNNYLLSMQEKGTWLLPKNTPKMYYDQLECWQVKQKDGKLVLREKSQNHYYDAEKYALAIFTILKGSLAVSKRIQAQTRKPLYHQSQLKPIRRNY